MISHYLNFKKLYISLIQQSVICDNFGETFVQSLSSLKKFTFFYRRRHTNLLLLTFNPSLPIAYPRKLTSVCFIFNLFLFSFRFVCLHLSKNPSTSSLGLQLLLCHNHHYQLSVHHFEQL